MKATYNNHLIEVSPGEEGVYHATIDGEGGLVEPAKYPRTTIRRAIQYLQRQEQEQECIENHQLLKEIMT